VRAGGGAAAWRRGAVVACTLRAVGWQHNARHVGVARGVAVLPLSEEGSRGVSWSVGFTRVQGGDVI
jgi:hypothetical protein